jgi:hypothetical protein
MKNLSAWRKKTQLAELRNALLRLSGESLSVDVGSIPSQRRTARTEVQTAIVCRAHCQRYLTSQGLKAVGSNLNMYE